MENRICFGVIFTFLDIILNGRFIAEYQNIGILDDMQWGIYALYKIARRSLSSNELQT